MAQASSSSFRRLAPVSLSPPAYARSVRRHRTHPLRGIMAKLLTFVGATVGGAIGWWLGARVGIMTAFMVSTLGTGVGIYAGRRCAGAILGGEGRRLTHVRRPNRTMLALVAQSARLPSPSFSSSRPTNGFGDTH